MIRKKKVRGKRRMYRNFRNIISEWSQSLPTPRDLSPTYLRYVAYDFDMYEEFKGYEDFSKAKKRELTQMMINFVKDLHDLKTEKEKEYRIIYFLPFPDLSRMFVSIGFTKAGLDSFYAGLNYNGQFEKDFELTTDVQFLQDEWGLHMPEGLEVKGFEGKTEIFKGESVWFVGNVR